METDWRRPDETIEDLQLGGLRLLQKKDSFRFGMDSVLLADFASVRPTDMVVDFGTGSGILPLLLIGRGKGRQFTGFEIQESLVEMAQRTMALNGLNDRVQIMGMDAGLAHTILSPGSVDAIVCNPPYGQPGTAMKNPQESRAIARHQEPDTLRRFCASAARLLRGRGKIAFVYPAKQMLFLMKLLHDAHLEPKRFRLVYPFADRPANLVLLEAVKDARPELQPLPPLIIYDRPGILTKELKSVYHIEE